MSCCTSMTVRGQDGTICRIEYRCLKRPAERFFTHAGVRCAYDSLSTYYLFSAAANGAKLANEKPAFSTPESSAIRKLTSRLLVTQQLSRTFSLPHNSVSERNR